MLLQSVPHPLDHLPSPRLSMRIETLFSSSRMTMVSHDRSVLSSSADSSPTEKKISLKQNLWGFDRVARSAHLFHSEDCTFKELPGLEIKPPLYVCFPLSSHCLQMFVMTESRSFVFESLFLQNASWGQQQ